MYVESHSTLKHVQTKDPKDHTLKQREFSISVDEDDFSTRYGEMDDDHFHYMMEAQDRKFYSTFSDPVFNFNDLCDSQVCEKCDLAVFSSGSNKDLGKESIQSASKLPVWKEGNSKFLDSDLEDIFSESEFEDEEVLAISDRGMKISKTLTNRVDAFLSDENQVISFIESLENEEYFTADEEDDSDVDFFDAEKSLDSDNEDLQDLPYSDSDSGYGSSVVSQIQAENDDEFFKEVCHLIAMTQPDEDGQNIIADILRNMPKMACGEVTSQNSMEDRRETDVPQDLLTNLSMMQTYEATNSDVENHATQVAQVVCDSSCITANSAKMPEELCKPCQKVTEVKNLQVQEGQLTESLDVPSQCSAVSACVGSSSGDLVLDKLENTKSELSPNSLNPQDLVLDVTEENDEDGIWSILTDNLHYLEVKSSFYSNPIKF